jgi:hypothetical protein
MEPMVVRVDGHAVWKCTPGALGEPEGDVRATEQVRLDPDRLGEEVG